MARIQEYNTEVGASADIGGRRAQGTDFYRGGNDGSALMNAADRIEDTVQRQEVSEVRAKMAEARAEWTVEMKTRADKGELGDSTFAEKFNEDFGNHVAKLGEGVRTAAGRAAYKESSALLSAHFLEASGIYQAESMGKKAVLDYSRALDANRNTLVQDPAQFPSVLLENERALADPNGPYGNMPAAKREELANVTRKELALSAVQGVIGKDPDFALEQLNKGAWAEYLDADKTVALKRSAEISIRAREIESNRLEAAAAKRQKEAERQTENAFIKQAVAEPGSVSAVDIANSILSPDDKLKWLGIIKKDDAEKPLKTDAKVFTDLFDRLHLPDDDPRAIKDEKQLDQYLGRGLSMEGLNNLRTELSGRRTEDGRIESELKKLHFDAVKSALTKSNGIIKDPKGDEQVLAYMSWFLPTYAKARKSGKTDLDLLTPDGPDYLGKNLDRYKRSFEQILNDVFPVSGAVKDYDDITDLVADVKSGKLSKQKGAEISKAKGWTR